MYHGGCIARNCTVWENTSLLLLWSCLLLVYLMAIKSYVGRDSEWVTTHLNNCNDYVKHCRIPLQLLFPAWSLLLLINSVASYTKSFHTFRHTYFFFCTFTALLWKQSNIQDKGHPGFIQFINFFFLFFF